MPDDDDEKRAREKFQYPAFPTDIEEGVADLQTVRACLDVLIAAEAWFEWKSLQQGLAQMMPHERILFHAVVYRRAVEAQRLIGDDDTARGMLRKPPKSEP